MQTKHSVHRISRRAFLGSATAGAVAWTFRPDRGTAAGTRPIRQVTRGPQYHWFAYYDKLEFDPTGRYLLGMEVDFEHRSPRPDDVIKIGMVDLEQDDRWIELGQSSAWCWQQGCMLQWRPGSASEILWNDRQGDRYVCHILDVQTKSRRTIPHPIYCVSPDGRWAVATDFRRLGDTRPGYGYNGIADPYRDQLAPGDSGVWHIDLETGQQRLIVSLADMAKIPFAYADFSQSKHWFNHLLVNPDGSRIEFLHRWDLPAGGRRTRMVTARPDGSDLRIIIDSGFASHFIWRDPQHILAYSKPKPEDPWGFHVHEDKAGGAVERIGQGVMDGGDGHCTYLPGNRWVLCDTYPDRERKIRVYLYHVAENRRVDLGVFHQPAEYWTGSPQHEWRCDLHPRCSPDGRWVVIDSPHTGQGRQLHLIDIRDIIK